MIRCAKKEDIKEILLMTEEVKEYFPGYRETEFAGALCEAISRNEAFLEEEKGETAGLVLFSHEAKELEFLAVLPKFQRRGIGRKLIEKVFSCFQKGEVLSVITFRRGDEKGEAARRCYDSLGFHEKEELLIFHYPCQRLEIKIGER